MGEGSETFFFGEVGRYGCQNDGLGEADTMVIRKRREGGREGGARTYRSVFLVVLGQEEEEGAAGEFF